MRRGRGERGGARRIPSWSALIVGSAVVLACRPARADNQAFTMDQASLLATVEWGTNDLDLGLGARLGYTLSPGIYVGGMFDYWFGETQSEAIPFGGGNISASAHGWDALAVAGYDFGPTPNVLLRPFAGGGVIRESAEACTPGGTGTETCVSASHSAGIGTFGGLIAARIDPVMLGGEARLLVGDSTSFVIGADVGVSF